MNDTEDEFNNDNELAPMVDGLSGALCVLILISTVFMISSTGKAYEEITGGRLKFRDSTVDLNAKVIVFNEGILLNQEQKDAIVENINQTTGSSVSVYSYIPEAVVNRKNKMIYNLFYFKTNIQTNKSTKLKIGDDKHCPSDKSCLYWEVN
ncbi:hypothetical protein M0K47_004976 [Escherichia coli]|uniref:hypothetical protein n=1 Tax=Escherichia TaxID=561 RepID=UPI000694DBFA|nr:MULTISPECIES: hypothetical protein [Escherichia]EIU7773803.1 hypothetical protein [Salmonella enterica]EGS5160190.1 hypothetical protein [Escherichia coli]EJM5548040.1 hypothetical protein [Salmonella enterica]EKX8151900.1 hypothetical protein [Escherichia coli]MBB7384184.1 hypothetical protein [Escherichia coli]